MKTLKELLELAQGSRTQNEFALHTGVSSGMLGKIKSGKRKPTKKLLRKIAEKAHNGVSYNDLIVSAGFLPEAQELKNNEELTPKMQTAINLVKQFDEKHLTTVIAMLESALAMQKEFKQTMIN